MLTGNLRLIALALVALPAFAQQPDIQATFMVDGSQVKDENRSHVSLEALKANSSVVYAYNGTSLNMYWVRMNKTAGSSKNPDRLETGVNSVFIADGGSKVEIESCEVVSHVDNSDGVTATGNGTSVIVNEGKISMYKDFSAAIYSMKGGEITVNETDIATNLKQSPLFRTGVGGIVNANKAVGSTSGIESAAFHSMGRIHAIGCRTTSELSPIGHVVAGGIIELEKSELKQLDGPCGFLAYGGNGSDQAEVSLTGNKLSVKKGPLFMVRNSKVKILLEGNSISQADECILNAKGADVTFAIEKQRAKGIIVTDSICSLNLSLGKDVQFDGEVNANGNDQAVVRISLAHGALWQLTGDSHVTSLDFTDPLAKGLKQIKGKYNLYYNAADPANSALEGKEYNLGGGLTFLYLRIM